MGIPIKQSEKLDIILRGLYEHRDAGYCGVREILKSNGIEVTLIEAWRLANRLRDDNYVSELASGGDDVVCEINTYGIEYCEESSYTYQGHSIITNNYSISITDSPNSAIVSNSQNVSIAISNYAEVKSKISELKDTVGKLDQITPEKRLDILECLQEVEATVDAGRIPKYSLRSLLSISSDVATVLPIVYVIAKLLGVPLP